MKTAVIISNMGGPHELDAVECYLYNIFMDPDIIDIPLPGFLKRHFVAWFAKKRAPESTEIYRKIGGKTPLTDISKIKPSLRASFQSSIGWTIGFKLPGKLSITIGVDLSSKSCHCQLA